VLHLWLLVITISQPEDCGFDWLPPTIDLTFLSPLGYNAVVMSFVRIITASLFLSVLCFTAARGWCAEENIDQQIAERIRQYQESLRQRAAELSPSLQAKIESQAQKTVAQGTAAWKNGDVNLQIALPRLAEVRRAAQFVSRHLPFSGAPSGSLEFGIGIVDAALTVSTVQYVAKSLSILSAHCIVRSLVRCSFQQSGGVSYFVRIVCTIVQRR
jgi:hypothetical protein